MVCLELTTSANSLRFLGRISLKYFGWKTQQFDDSDATRFTKKSCHVAGKLAVVQQVIAIHRGHVRARRSSMALPPWLSLDGEKKSCKII